MSTGRPCVICSDAEKLRLVAQLIGKGATDQAIAIRLGGIHRMAVSRHRRNHVEAPAKVLVKAAAKGRDMIEQRAQMLAAAEAGDPVAFLALAAIVDGLRRTDERLERVAASAEQDGQRLAVSALSAQQIRLAETKAKLGGVGGDYRTPAAGPGGGGDGARFSVNIIFSNGQQETITTIDNPSALEVDAQDPDE